MERTKIANEVRVVERRKVRTMLIEQGLQYARINYGNDEAIVCGETRYTWQKIAERVDRIAEKLVSLGITHGDRVAVLMLNCHRYLELYYACATIGAVIVPLNTRLAEAEITFILNDCSPKMLVLDETFEQYVKLQAEVSSIEHILYTGNSAIPGTIAYETICMTKPSLQKVTSNQNNERGDNALAAIFYTGGTTGRAKGVMLSHRNLIANALHFIITFHCLQTDIWLHAAPMFHIADACGIFAFTMLGAKHILLARFQPEQVLQAIQAEQVTSTVLVPAMIQMLLQHYQHDVHDMSSMRCLISGGAPIPVEVLKRAVQHWGKIVYHAYGMTEAAPLIAVLDAARITIDGTPVEERRLTSCGKPMIGTEVCVLDEDGNQVQQEIAGEICIRGEHITSGYWGMPGAIQEVCRNGWFHTGEIGMFDTEQMLYVLDRRKDMIISGGENIYSVEVENVLYMHPAILEAAVIGIPDEQWGEAVHAIIVCKANMDISEDELMAFVRQYLAGYKVPRTITFSKEPLPKSGAGKILKRSLREQHQPVTVISSTNH